MKTKFSIDNEIFDSRTLQDSYKYYEDYYKEDGWLLDKQTEDVYMIIEREINLNIGDMVELFGLRSISWKCYNVKDDIMEYNLIEA